MPPALFPFQVDGAAWLTRHRFRLLADEMGLGKSAQCVHAADLCDAKRVLVICPAVARRNWAREFATFSSHPREFKLIETQSDLQGHGGAHSIICSYDLLDPDAPELAGTWDVLIIDESHYLKNTETRRTAAIYGANGVARRARRVWAVSGTPAPNHYGELWVMLHAFGATKLGYAGFLDRYCHTMVDSRMQLRVVGSRADTAPELRKILESVMLRRKKEEVMKELPPIFYQDIEVDPSPVDLEVDSFIHYIFPQDRRHVLEADLAKQRMAVQSVVDLVKLGPSGLDALKAMANSVSTLRRYNGLEKMPACAEIVRRELESGAYDKIVIFAIHRDVIEGTRLALRKYGAVTLYGNTEPSRKQRHIDKFQRDPKCRVFVGNIQAAGTNITLTAAHQVLFIEQSWVPGDNAQAAMRCHRIGQTRPVFVRFASLANSLDHRVSQVLKRKTRDLTRIFDDEREVILAGVDEFDDRDAKKSLQESQNDLKFSVTDASQLSDELKKLF